MVDRPMAQVAPGHILAVPVLSRRWRAKQLHRWTDGAISSALQNAERTGRTRSPGSSSEGSACRSCTLADASTPSWHGPWPLAPREAYLTQWCTCMGHHSFIV